MPRIVVKEIGLYDEIEYDNRGFPKHGTPATLTVSQGKDFDVILLVRLSGDPGSYWLTAQMEAPEPYRVDISLPNEHVIAVRRGELGGRGRHLRASSATVPCAVLLRPR